MIDRATRFLFCALLFLAPLPVAARSWQDGPPSEEPGPIDAHLRSAPLVRTVPTTASIDLDGRLDEQAWRTVTATTGFIQTEPQEGKPATERTEVYVLYDEDAIYIGARLWDSSGKVARRLGRRDSFLGDSDWFYVMLDSYHDHQSAFQFSVNPSGVKRDEINTGSFRPDASWDAVWDAATSIDDEGWTVEMRIPFSQLRFSHLHQQTWGIQFTRRLISRDEVSVLSFTPKSERGGVARYAHLIGLNGIRPGKRVELLPYTIAKAAYVAAAAGNPFRDGSDYSSGSGLDLKYRVTSSLTLDATINPDFGQVEVDPAVVNLSAFETSYDEKRPFFVEGSDIFRFDDMKMFYSRRIGRSPQGSMPEDTRFSDRPDVSTILGAAKMTGQTLGGWKLGFVEAVTARETASFIGLDDREGNAAVEPATNYLVARADRSLRAGQTSIGAIATAMNRRIEDAGLEDLLRSSAYTAGLDFSHEFAGRTWSLSGYYAFSHVSGSPLALVRTQRSSARYFQRPDADYVELDSSRTSLAGQAAKLELRRIAGLHWRGSAGLSTTTPGFEINDLGFQSTVDRIGTDLELTWVENQPGDVFRNYRVNGRLSRDWNYGRDAVGGRASISFNGELANYWGGNVSFTRSFSAFDDHLTRGGPIAINPAGYNVDFRLNSDGRRSVSLRSGGNYSWGESGGWHRTANAGMTIRPAGNWTISVGPKLSQSRTSAQYVGYEEDAAAVATYGRRYIFAPVEQTTLSMETRLNVNLTPELSLEMYGQPFVSSGDYGEAMTLRAPRTYDFDPYEGSVEDRDFNTRSLRGNAVLRWEWRPGSTVFLVWQQQRSGSLECPQSRPRCDNGRFDFSRDARSIFDPHPDNVFLLKLNYWLNL